MKTISRGYKGPEALFLQRLLNKRAGQSRVVEDGDFGPRTHAAVVAFQQANGIAPANGVVSAAVWQRLGAAIEQEHRVTLFGQPTNMTCWSAAATMVVGNMSIDHGPARVGQGGGLEPPLENIETFVRSLGWSVLNNQSAPPAQVLIQGMTRSPLWVAFEGGTFKHAVVVSGIWSDRTNEGTVLRIHDPWPPNRGTLYSTSYEDRRIALRSVTPPRAAMIQYIAGPR